MIHWTMSTGYSMAESVNVAFPLEGACSLAVAHAEFDAYLKRWVR